jgi:hypothetical protein
LLKVSNFDELKIAEIESCQNWKLPKLEIAINWKLPKLKVGKVEVISAFFAKR